MLYNISIVLKFIIGISFTSGKAKYQVNTSTWPTSGALMQYGQLDSWKWFDENVPDNSKVYYACDHLFVGADVIGVDQSEHN